MGLFDKIFGGGKRQEPGPSSSTPSSPAPVPPAPEGPVPPRRERSKPGQPAASDAPPASPAPFSDGAPVDAPPGGAAVELPPLPMDGENAALLAAINGVIAADNPDTRTTLYTAMLSADVFLVSMGHEEANGGAEGEVKLQEGQQLSLATIKGPDGNIYLPAFTDIERLSRTLPGEGARYVRVPLRAVCQMFLQGAGAGIVLNPAMPPSGMISRAEAEILATGNVPQIDPEGNLQTQAQQPMRIAIGKPPTPPADSFVDAIRAKAAELPNIREVHLFHAGVQEQPPRLMIGLLLDNDLTPDQMHPNFEAIGKAAYDNRGDTEAFDMMPLNDQMIEAIRPLEGVIYSRDQQV